MSPVIAVNPTTAASADSATTLTASKCVAIAYETIEVARLNAAFENYFGTAT